MFLYSLFYMDFMLGPFQIEKVSLGVCMHMLGGCKLQGLKMKGTPLLATDAGFFFYASTEPIAVYSLSCLAAPKMVPGKSFHPALQYTYSLLQSRGWMFLMWENRE